MSDRTDELETLFFILIYFFLGNEEYLQGTARWKEGDDQPGFFNASGVRRETISVFSISASISKVKADSCRSRLVTSCRMAYWKQQCISCVPPLLQEEHDRL